MSYVIIIRALLLQSNRDSSAISSPPFVPMRSGCLLCFHKASYLSCHKGYLYTQDWLCVDSVFILSLEKRLHSHVSGAGCLFAGQLLSLHVESRGARTGTFHVHFLVQPRCFDSSLARSFLSCFGPA